MNHHNYVARVGWEITNKCIDSRSTVVSSYAQSNHFTSEQENPITRAIQPWLQAAVSELNSDAVLTEIWLGVKYQKV
jgi:hypothetical protein